MNTTYRVQTATTDGMHEVVAIVRQSPDGGEAPAAPADAELALIRSAVRGQLDLLGHEAGPAVTVVALDADQPTILSCVPAST